MSLRKIADAGLYVAAAAMVYLAIRTHVRPGTNAPPPIPNWSELVTSGTVVGSTAARVVILEFLDYECPHCRRIHATLARLADQFPDHLAISYKQFPLPSHDQANGAAAAALCADQRGRFREYHGTLLLGSTTLLRSRSWMKIARTVNVPDTAAFHRCLSSASVRLRIRRDVEDGRKLGVAGTPAFFINGHRFTSLDPDKDLPGAVRQRIRSGNAP
ncbi:MAG TPA: thioredoxin domain-containing protein [Gemmatimonadaceae bacterium]|nr:thioredoxin domain-containing protein [Gemmatimonadaceae bacterium]